MSFSGTLKKIRKKSSESRLLDRIKGWKDLPDIKRGTHVEFDYLDENQQRSKVLGKFRGRKKGKIKFGEYHQEFLDQEEPTQLYKAGNTLILKESGIESKIEPTKQDIIKSKFDNLWHPDDESNGNPHRNRWWYFVLFCENETVVSGSLNLNGTDKIIGETSVSIYQPNKNSIQLSKTYEDFEASQDRFHVKLGKSEFFEEDGQYHLKIKEGRIKLEIKGEPEESLESALEVNVNNGYAGQMKWGIPILKGSFKGELKIDGQKEKIKGIIFHDHNLDNVVRGPHTLRHYRGWTWGINYKKDETIIFMKAFYEPEDINLIVYQKGPEKFCQKTNNSVFVEKDGSVRVLINGEEYLFNPENSHALKCPIKSSLIEGTMEKYLFKRKHAYSNSDPDNLLYIEEKKARNIRQEIVDNVKNSEIVNNLRGKIQKPYNKFQEFHGKLKRLINKK